MTEYKLDRSEDSPIVGIKGNDPQMQAAYQKARDTFKYFWREMTWEYRRIVPGLAMAAIKAAFTDTDFSEDAEVEHMWVNEVEFDGVHISGKLLNQPNWLKKYSAGDDVQIEYSRLEDWMYADHQGEVFGGFTVDLMRSQMSAGERRNHDGAWGLQFPEPGKVELVPNPNKPKPEPVGCLGALLGKKPAPLPPYDPVNPDDEHPMSENMVAPYREKIQASPELLTDTDENGWTQLHYMALGGALTAVKLMLELGADKNVKTNHGMTALDLASVLNWTKVIAVLEAD